MNVDSEFNSPSLPLLELRSTRGRPLLVSGWSLPALCRRPRGGRRKAGVDPVSWRGGGCGGTVGGADRLAEIVRHLV